MDRQDHAFEIAAIDRIWSSHPVKFCIIQDDINLYIGYFDTNRQLTIASRKIKRPHWVYHKLNTWLAWDSHNSIAMGVDQNGNLHVAANMHAEPLIYFKTTKPGNIRTLKRLSSMVDARRERHVTYPIFLKDASHHLIFKYRDGASGRGDEIYLIYDSGADKWQYLLETPLVDGEKQRNGYFVGPTLGPDGWFHLVWVWRNTPDAATNQDLSYARSRDLVDWQRSDGTSLTLPIRLATAEIVDPVPVHGGMINNNTLIGFDSQKNVLIAYHKFDAAGQTQVYLAKHVAVGWSIHQITHWADFRWDFGGYGTIRPRLVLSSPAPDENEVLVIPIVRDDVRIDLVVDERTLALIAERPSNDLQTRLRSFVRIPEGMDLHIATEAWSASKQPLSIAWTTRPENRDRPYPDITDPTTLMLISAEQHERNEGA